MAKNEEKPTMADIYEKLQERPMINTEQRQTIVANFVHGGFVYDAGDTPTDAAAEHSRFIEYLVDGKIEQSRLDHYLRTVPAQFDEEPMSEIFSDLNKFSRAHQIKGIIASAFDPDSFREAFKRRDEVDAGDLKVLTIIYPLPADLEKACSKLFREVMLAHGNWKEEEYKDSLRVLEYLTYGLRYQFSEQLKWLQSEKKPHISDPEDYALF